MNLGIKGPLLRSPYFIGGRKQLIDPTIEEGMVESDLIELVSRTGNQHSLAIEAQGSESVPSLLTTRFHNVYSFS